MKKRILLDIDGVIANFYKSFASFLNEHYDCWLPLDNEPDYYDFDKWGHGVSYVDIEKASKEWILQDGMLNVPAFPNATEFVNKLNDIYDVHIVTARVGDWQKIMPESTVEKIKNNTLNWLKNNNIPHDKLFFTHEKVDFCNDYGISIMIEDKLSTALKASKAGIHTILIDRAYNQSKSDRLRIYRAFTLDEVFDLIEKIYK